MSSLEGSAYIATLGYADDAALIDSSEEIASERVSNIAYGSKLEADMEINIDKTECTHVQRQQRVAAPEKQDATKVCKYKCKNPGCGWIFGNKMGLKIHQGKWCQGRGSIRWCWIRSDQDFRRFFKILKICGFMAKPRCRRHRKQGSPLGGRKFGKYHLIDKIIVLPYYSIFWIRNVY